MSNTVLKLLFTTSSSSSSFFFFFLISLITRPVTAAENYSTSTTSDTLDISKLSSNYSTNQIIQLAHAANTSLPILLSSDAAYSWQFFPYPRNEMQRLLVVLSTLYNTTVVWIANRDRPASPNASLSLDLSSRSLSLLEPNGSLIWSPSVRNISSIVMNTTGNLYFLASSAAGGSATVEWQSFDVPADVFIPGQRLRTNHTSTASLAWNDWASGHYTLKANPGGAVLYATFDTQQNMVPYTILNYITSNNSLAGSLYSACNHTTILYNQDASGVTLEQDGSISPECLEQDENSVHGISFATRIGGDGYRFLRIMPTGDINSFFLSSSTGLRLDNELFKGFYSTYCRLPSYCGINSLCSSIQTCTCPQLFEAIDPSDSTQGCRLQTPLNCTIFRQHQFLQVAGSDYYANTYLSPRQIVENPTDCTNLCLQNCSCTAAFYNNETGACHVYDQVRTMQFGSNPSVTAFLRVASLPPSGQGNGNGPFPRKVVIGVSVAAGAVFLIMVGLIGIIGRRLMKARLDEDSDSEEEAFLEGLPGLPPRFSYKELHDATEGFSKQLGKGGSGAVFEGNLHFPSAADKNAHESRKQQAQQQQQLVKVAVKELTLSEYSNIAAASKRHFRAEVATLGNLSHVNLVQLKGFCAEGMHRLLVYEFLENSSLDQWIFPSNSKEAAAAGVVLPWEVRYRIALDTARGLAFLHEECRERVVHLDVKPQNILLDAGFRAKLADFGLSKLMERGHSQTVTAMRGTPGYMAPEWFLNLPITDRSDVFSYGMVLLELVGGRKNLNTAAATSEEWYFPAWAVKQAGNGRIGEVVDKRLLAQLHSQNTAQADQNGNNILAAGDNFGAPGQGAAATAGLLKMERLINVAFWCIQEDASSRPSMTTVVLMLEEHLQVPDPPLEMAYIPRRVQPAGRRAHGPFTTTSSGSYTTTNSSPSALSSSYTSGAAPEIPSVLFPR